MQELKIMLMNAGYILDYAYHIDGRLAQDIRDPKTHQVVGTILEPKKGGDWFAA